MDEKLKKIIFIVIGVFVVLFLFLFMMTSCKKKYEPNELEELIFRSATNYYENNNQELPSIDSKIELSLSELAAKGIINDLDDLVEKGTTCFGHLTIENNNGYYMYSPSINCENSEEKYESKNLKTTLLEQETTIGEGLYFINNEYHFRGNNVDNYLIFDGLLWRIMKINNDNSIRIILETRNSTVSWDKRYNEDRKTNNGYNDIIYNNINSAIKNTLDEYYESEDILSNDAKGFIKKTTLCVGKRLETDTLTDGSIECSNTLSDQYLGLIQMNEYMLASLDNNCTTLNSKSCRNDNYLANFDVPYWTLTADASNSYKVYKITKSGESVTASSSAMARLVINLSENTNVTGTGTEEDPYVVSGLRSELRKLK